MPKARNKQRRFGLGFRGLIRRIRPKPRPKPVRNPENPVRVVFTCPGGARCTFVTEAFSDVLQKKKIRSVQCMALPFNFDHLGIMPVVLKEADIILHFFNDAKVARRRIRKFSKKGAIVGKFPDYIEFFQIGDRIDFTGLFELINENYSLKEK